jgi:hypothetical protein
LGHHRPIDGEGLAIKGKRIERRIEDLGTDARMGCKGIWIRLAVFEKCHGKYDVS